MSFEYIEIVPQEIKVLQNGRKNKVNPVSAGLIISWIRPNENNDVVKGQVSGIHLSGGKIYNDFPTETALELEKNQVLKTKTIGRSVLKVEVVVAREAGILNKVFATVFKAGLGMATIANPIVSALHGLAKGEVEKEILRDQTTSLGIGLYKYAPENPEKRVTIELKAPDTIICVDPRAYPDAVNPDPEPPEVMLKKGSKNGRVILNLNRLES